MKIEKVEFSFYQLVPKHRPNARVKEASSTSPSTSDPVWPSRSGALLKLHFKSEFGVADIFPWPELGDLNLQDQIRLKGPLFQRAFQLAEEDLKARLEKKSLLNDKWLRCYQTMAPDEGLDADRIRNLLDQSSESPLHIKIKGTSNYKDLAKTLNSLPELITVRLDFNSCLTAFDFEDFFSLLKKPKQIQYVEDPFPFEPSSWQKWNLKIPLAADFEKASTGYTYKVFKPSREPWPRDKKLIYTSAMDHAVGHIHAFRLAQQNISGSAVAATDVAGFLSVNLYQPDFFSNCFELRNKTELNFSNQCLAEAEACFGIGLNSILKKLVWVSEV